MQFRMLAVNIIDCVSRTVELVWEMHGGGPITMFESRRAILSYRVRWSAPLQNSSTPIKFSSSNSSAYEPAACPAPREKNRRCAH